MSGLEALGAIAAASQLFGYLFKLLGALLELRDHIKHSSARVQTYVERLESLARIVQYIQANPTLLSHVVETLLGTISQKVDTLNSILRKSFSTVPRRPSQRFMRVYAEKKAERRIRESLANLDSYKIDLIICISGSRQMATEQINTGRVLEAGDVPPEVSPQNNELAPIPRNDSFGSTSSTESTETFAGGEEEECTGDKQKNLSTHIDNEIYDSPVGAIGNLGSVDSQGQGRFQRNKVGRCGFAFIGNANVEATKELIKSAHTLRIPLQPIEQKEHN